MVSLRVLAVSQGDFMTLFPQLSNFLFSPRHRRGLSRFGYEDAFEDLFNAKYIIDLIKAIWDPETPYKLLDCGSANGLTLKQFDKLGIEAWGIENNAHIHSKTPEGWRGRNLLGDVLKIPFEDGSFEFVYVTCLPYLPEEKVDQALKELFRVCRVGMVFQSVTTDMTEEVIEDYMLFRGLQTFWTFSEWSDAFVRNGFKLAVSNSALLDEIWRIEQETDEDDWNWYPNKESMRVSERMCKQVSVSLPCRGDSHDCDDDNT
jgi:SAM-dependent methyltransferase